MLCPNCQEGFNSEAHLPRILIFCGHTYCHTCIEQLITTEQDKKQLVCPECSVVNLAADGVNSFPKNLVLLQVNQGSHNQPTSIPSKGDPPHSSNTGNTNNINENIDVCKTTSNSNKEANEEENSSSQNKTESQGKGKTTCSEHNKKLEAFCEKDLQVLCIDCILSDQHKSHEIISVSKAVEKQKQLMFEAVSEAHDNEEKLRFLTSDIKRHIGEMQLQAENNRREISAIYGYIKELIMEREQNLKKQISDNLQKEEDECLQKLAEINESMNRVSSFKSELVQQSHEQDLELLAKAKHRIHFASEVNGLKCKDLVNYSIQNAASQHFSLLEIKRELELTQISKIVHPSFKGSINQFNSFGSQFQSNSAGGSSLYQHTLSTANKMKKQHTLQEKSVQGPTISVYQNVNPGEKAVNPSGSSNLSKDKEELGKTPGQRVTAKQKGRGPSPHRNIRKPENNPKKEAPKTVPSNGCIVLDQKQGSTKQSTSKAGRGTQFAYPSRDKQTPTQQETFSSCLNMGKAGHNFQYDKHPDEYEEEFPGHHGEEVSTIYPVETHDCYYQDSPKQKPKCQEANLDELLESLNKSHHHDLPKQRESSTASETGGSSNNDHGEKARIVTPKEANWGLDNNSGLKKTMKKDNSLSEFEEVKSKNASPIKKEDPWKLHAYKGQEWQDSGQKCKWVRERSSHVEDKVGSRSESLQKQAFGKKENRLFQNKKNFVKSPRKEEDQQEDNEERKSYTLRDSFQKNNSQNDYYGEDLVQVVSAKISPVKEQRSFPAEEREQLMMMLQECTKTISQIELKPKKQSKDVSVTSSPAKEQLQNYPKTTTICLVDLAQEQQRPEGETVRAIIREEDFEEHSVKQIPNASTQKENSPFKEQSNVLRSSDKDGFTLIKLPEVQKQDQEFFEEGEHYFVQEERDFDERPSMESPTKMGFLKESPIKSQNFEGPTLSPLEDPALMASLASDFNQFQSHSIANNVSVDVSINDPFRALCKMKEEFIFVFSGFNDSKLFTCECLDIQRGVWKEIAAIGKPRTKFAAVPISKSRILLFGGKQTDGQRTGEIEEYNLKTNKFKLLPFKMPKPRSGFAACVKKDEGKIFFCGGNSSSVLRKFDCLDLKKGKWTKNPEMIQKRDELAVALGPDGKIYAIGGYGGGGHNVSQGETSSDSKGQSNCLKTAERYDFNTGEWEMLPEMNQARRALAAVALPDGIYAIGGYDGKQYLDSVEKFDLLTQQWVEVKSMQKSRCTLSAVASADFQYIYALGGFNGNSLDLVERYDTVNDHWEVISPMISKRFMHEAVALVTH